MSVHALNRTHDPSRRSWVRTANESNSDFPIQNLPFGAFRRRGIDQPSRCGVAIGNEILDLSAAAPLFQGEARIAAAACGHSTLNELAALGQTARSALRLAVFDLLDEENDRGQNVASRFLVPQSEVDLLLPFSVSAFTDFFASIFHATNAGRMFRPDQPLLPNYKFVPIAYNGRASTLRPSGADVRRPLGQIKSPDAVVPERLPTRALDYEVELGIYIGTESKLGESVAVDRAREYVFGACLLNDWSARDIQAWEYQPLGPFLAKTFATSVSPWVVTEEALRPFRTHAFIRSPGDPEPLSYLDDAEDRASGGLDITLEACLQTSEMKRRNIEPLRLSRSSSDKLYWTVSQMIAHQTSNGCNLQVGDLIGSGTISGEEQGSFGSLLEITRRGLSPLVLPTGEMRTFLEDGDEVAFTGFCERPGFVRIGFGSCKGSILPATVSPQATSEFANREKPRTEGAL